MYNYLEKSKNEIMYSKHKYIINSERYENAYGKFSSNKIFFKSCYQFDSPIQTFNNIKREMYSKIVDKSMLPYIEAVFKVIRFNNTWEAYFLTFNKIVTSETFQKFPLKVQVYFSSIFISSIRGFVFEDEYVKDHNLKTNERWDIVYKIDAYEEVNGEYYMYQIKSFPIAFMYENFEDWNSLIYELKKEFNITKPIKVFKVFMDGKKLVYQS